MTVLDLDADLVQGLLQTERYGRSLDLRTETGSTNDDARAAAEGGAPDGHVVVADAQSAGRGRHGNSWSSPPGTDLYFSVVTRPGVTAAALPPLTLAVGVAIAEVAEELSGRRAMVKWPNDVWIDGRKVAGILVETSTRAGHSPAVIVGVGLDVNRREWPPELRELATSLAEARGDQDLGRAAVLADVLGAMERWVDRYVDGGAPVVVDALDHRLALRGERVTVDGVAGVLEGIAPSGAARVRTGAGTREVTAGTLERA